MKHRVVLSNGSVVYLTEGTECLHVDLAPPNDTGVNVVTIYEKQSVITHPPRYGTELLAGFMKDLSYNDPDPIVPTCEPVELVGQMIDLARSQGYRMDSPYDFENFIMDHADQHTDLFATGRFEVEEMTDADDPATD